MTRLLLRRGNHCLLPCVLQLRNLVLTYLSYENCHLSDADRAQELARIGSWVAFTTECLESVREVEDILSGELELS